MEFRIKHHGFVRWQRIIGGIAFYFSFMEGSAEASIEFAKAFCSEFSTAKGCGLDHASCVMCHAGPPSLNDYGKDLKDQGAIDSTSLISVAKNLMDKDSDLDGFKNHEEIRSASIPGDKQSRPAKKIDLIYDFSIAFKRIKSLYCGEKANFSDLRLLEKDSDPKSMLHAALTQCLESKYWKKEALYRLADKKIQPLSAVGFGGNVVIGDYQWDYRLFSYVMTGDRDVRDLLGAQYHIDSEGNRIEGEIDREEPFQLGKRIVIAGGQPLEPQRRAGMITTQWFLSFFTMFAQLPRNTASQAYRAYLGLDLAKGEGIHPINGEPRDVDNKRVMQADCAVCHSTLDPLAYAFSTYKGIVVSASLAIGNPIGTYDPDRAPWEAEGAIFDKSVSNLLEWAEVARNSDEFKRNIATMLFEHAFSRRPLAHETQEFNELWQNLASDQYSVNRLLHRLVDMKVFGGRRP